MASRNDTRGVRAYAALVITGSLMLSALLYALHFSVGARGSGALVLAAMWIPALGRLLATRAFEPEWRSPYPLRRWGHPPWAVILVPLSIVTAIYVGSYALAALAAIPREPAVWPGASLAANVAVNLPLLAIIGVAGSLGEELGWRGYLQPRLDQLGIPAPLLCVIVLETAFHIPLILLAGYTAGPSRAISVALFLGLKLGATPVWTWASRRWRTIWMAVCFHTFHNAISQVLVPKALGAGDQSILGEYGVLPVALYLIAAGAVLVISKLRGCS